MKKKLLCCALFGALGLAQTAVADEMLDDRWYLSGSLGGVDFDSGRGLKNRPSLGIGLGKFHSTRWSWDVELFHVNPQKRGTELNWSQYSAALVGRYHFRDGGESWWPYFAFGLGAQRHENEFSSFTGGRPVDNKGTNLLAQLGVGLQADYGRTALRTEVGLRADFDDESVAGDSYFLDRVASISLVVKLGPEPARAVEPAPARTPPPAPVTTCADLDDDGDGVNNCDDKCPDTKPGQVVGPDGCPVPLTIDLRGVNFDFDKSTLRPDAIAILDEAVRILSQYSEIRVEVAGHTDLCGSDGYNQSLSERRARAVYDYLTSKGIAASRLAGPNGYGESRPLESTGQGFPGCKNERNRRTELNVQN